LGLFSGRFLKSYKMALPDIFTKVVSEKIINRIDALTPAVSAAWGKMNASQMLAHCSITYEMIYEDKHPKPNFIMKFMLKSLVKKLVTNESPYQKSSRTAPAFLISGERNFEPEKNRLISYIRKSQELGENTFDNKESPSFGRLNKIEWNNMFYEHLDHHLTQFGV